MDWQAVLLDFDGVILESNEARTEGFRKLFPEHSPEHVEALVSHHIRNGGMSRYAKIENYFRNILGQEITEEERDRHARRFSDIVTGLVLASPFVPGAKEFILGGHCFPLFITSGSDQDELRGIAAKLGIADRFTGILGSPTAKTANISQLLKTKAYSPDRVVLVGDSHNDLTAARDNGIAFIARASSGAAWIEGSARIDDLRALEDALGKVPAGGLDA